MLLNRSAGTRSAAQRLIAAERFCEQRSALASIYDLKQYAGAISHAPWPILVARIGYVAGGTVYAIIGAFAILAAIGAGARIVGSKGALTALVSEPAGRLLLALVAAGLACFGIWRGLGVCSTGTTPD